MAEKTQQRGRGNSLPAIDVRELKNKAQKGKAAEALLKNTTLTKALNEMRKNATDRIIASEPADERLREDMYRFVKTIGALEQQLKVYFNKGASAAKKLEAVLQNGG